MFYTGNAFVGEAAMISFFIADEAFGLNGFVEGNLKIWCHDFYFLFAAKKVLDDKGYTVELGEEFLVYFS